MAEITACLVCGTRNRVPRLGELAGRLKVVKVNVDEAPGVAGHTAERPPGAHGLSG